jgi:hypothetical protein
MNGLNGFGSDMTANFISMLIHRTKTATPAANPIKRFFTEKPFFMSISVYLFHKSSRTTATSTVFTG